MANFSEKQIKTIWDSLTTFPNENPNIFRYDPCGAKIKFSDYDNRESEFGWTIDHKYPVSLGGNNHPKNLQALHWKTNEKKADNFPDFEAEVQWNPQTGKNDRPIVKSMTVGTLFLNEIGIELASK